MDTSKRWDAVVVGAGPNGLAAAIRLGDAGRSVLVVEAAEQPGGCLRTEVLLEPGFRHDVCASVQALVPLSPAMSSLAVDLVLPDAPLAHPFDDGSAVVLHRSVDETAQGLGADGRAYRRLVAPLVRGAGPLFASILGPVLQVPRHPALLTRIGVPGVLPASLLAKLIFRDGRARALLAGAAAHSMLSLHEPVTAGYGLAMLISAHAGGWPFALSGSSAVADALVNRLHTAGGEVRCGQKVLSLAELPSSRAVLLDLVPQAVLEVSGTELPSGYRRRLARYRLGPGVFKLDWTLDGPIPWRASECGLAGTVHLGGTLEEIAAAEHDVARGRHPKRPFIILTQPTLFDSSRAPPGRHVAWAYCHVPNGSGRDMTDAIEDQVERFAPGFRDVVRARSAWTPSTLEQQEPNCVGGDINGGRQDLPQLLFRPVPRLNPYTTPNPSLYICSAATPPGGGVHGMCGWHAAGAVLRREASTSPLPPAGEGVGR
jgi:phytoene dehydrogenase-like protein